MTPEEERLSAALLAEAEGCLPGPALEEILARAGSWHARAWACWGAALGVFAAVEAHALATGTPDGTLTHQLRRYPRLAAALVAAGAVWLVAHILAEVEQ